MHAVTHKPCELLYALAVTALEYISCAGGATREINARSLAISNAVRRSGCSSLAIRGTVVLALAMVFILDAYPEISTPKESTSAGESITATFPGIVAVDGVNYSTIQSAIDAAGKNQTVFIPSTYNGTDSFRNQNNIRVFDLRRRFSLDTGLWRNVSEWGAKLDAQMVAGCSTSSTGSLTCNGASFAPSDAGKTLICYGCGVANGAGNNNLVTTISKVASAHNLVLTTTTSYSGGGRNIVYGTDDTAAFNAAIASFSGNTAATALKYGKLGFCGMSIISNTLFFYQYGGEFSGCGWGSFSGNMGSKLIWAGPAGVPMLNLQGGEGATLHDFQLFGNSTAMPIGLQLTRMGTEAFIGSYNHFDHIWFGAMYDGEPDTLSGQLYNMGTGVFAHGPGGNDDFQRLTTIVMNRVKYGSDSDAMQAVYWDWQTLLVLYAQNGFSIVGDHVHGRNWFFAGNTLDLSLGSPNFPYLRGLALLDDFGVEHSAQMLTYVNRGSGQVVINGGKWQAFPSSTIPSGKVIDLQTAAGSDSLQLTHFRFTYKLPYTGPALNLVFGNPNGMAGQSVIFHDVTGITPANITLNAGGARGAIPPNVTFEWINSPGNGDAGEEAKRVVSSRDNSFTPYRKDYQGQMNLTGGPLHVLKASPPANFFCTPKGAGGATVYVYQTTCIAGGKESLPTGRITCSSAKPLTSSNYNLLTFFNMQGCDSYNIYGDVDGAIGLLGNVGRGFSSDAGVNYPHQKFVDNGSYTPGKPVPSTDETGGVTIDGTLTVANLNVTGTTSGGTFTGCDLRHTPCRVGTTGNLTEQTASISKTPLFTTSDNGGQYRVSCSLSVVASGASGTVTVCVNYELIAAAATDCSQNIKLAEPGAHSSLNVIEWMGANRTLSYYTTVVSNQGGRYQVSCSAHQEQ
jgi:hypothetical protein